MKISYVVPTVNQVKMVFDACLGSFHKYHPGNHEIIIVDDGSPAHIQSQVASEAVSRQYTFLKNDKNSGFSVTVNKGIRAATGDAVVVVNNDIVFTQEIESKFSESFEADSKTGIVGGLLFYPHGTIQHGGIMRNGPFGFTHRGWHKSITQCQELTKPEYLIAVTGAIFGIRKKMVNEIGAFKEDYFLACEDTELCLRAWSRGWRVHYNPKIQAIHAEGGTRGRTDFEKQKHHRTWYLKELETNQKFLRDLQKMNLQQIEQNVSEANAEHLGLRDDGPQSEMVRFQSGQARFRKVLVKRAGALGDVILATGIIRRLNEMGAEVSVQTVCGEVFRGNPRVKAVAHHISEKDFDQVIDLDMAYEKSPKSPIWHAYSKIAFGEVVADLNPEMFSDPADADSLRKKTGAMDLCESVVIHMGVGWANRTWPRHSWNEVTKALSELGQQVIVVGKGNDYRSSLYPGVTNLVDILSISEIRELLKQARCFVGMDSGILHVAQTTEVPIVGLFTVADPRNRIVTRKQKTIAIVPKVNCRFCLHEEKPPVTFVACKYGTNHCLNDIQPDAVVEAIQECLS